MSQINSGNGRKPIFQNYYSKQDYVDTLTKLPDIIKVLERKSLEMIEPTIFEQRDVMNSIKEFLKIKKRKIYGGTAVNELIKQVNPTEAIYDDYSFGDIDFYSPQPRADVVELCNYLFAMKKYKHINANEAQHDGTYRIYVNWQLYCNITYVPKNIYLGIKATIINGLQYVDPHFIWIDQLRIYCNPLLTTRLLEKTFKREYLLLKNYPLEYFENNFQSQIYPVENANYIHKIKQEFLPNCDAIMINGFDAYNFYVKYAKENMESPLPFLDLIADNYSETVIKLYAYVRSIVINPGLMGIIEYSPFFQFTGHSVMIKYNEQPLVLIQEIKDISVPIINVSSGIKYASYQYLLMSLLINKFRSFIDKNKQMYFNYSTASSNLIKIKNDYLKEHKINAINNSPFSILKTTCIGTPVSPARLYLCRRNERRENGKKPEFTYEPEKFFKTSEESQKKFDPLRIGYKNASGNIIIQPKYMRFMITGDNLTERNIDENPDENPDETIDENPDEIIDENPEEESKNESEK
jgi:hypothetical protein